MGWGIWIIRFAISFVTIGGTALIGSFYVADYVSEKHVRGLTVAVDTLDSSLTNLNNTVTSINTNLSQQLISLERDRAKLAIEIARELQKLQGDL